MAACSVLSGLLSLINDIWIHTCGCASDYHIDCILLIYIDLDWVDSCEVESAALS